jgi:MFS family permease
MIFTIMLKFLKNDMNLMYLSVFFSTLSAGLISIFVPIFLYSLDYSIVDILFFYFLMSFYFVLFSITGAKIVSKIGDKHAMLLSTLFTILFYIGLLYGLENYFYVLPLLASFGTIFYNFGFHLNFMVHSDSKKRGKQLSYLDIVSIVASVLSPLFGGLIISVFGYDYIFVVGSVLLFISIFPLFLTKDNFESSVDINLTKMLYFLKKKMSFGNFLSFSGYAIETSIGRIIWPIFLIILFVNVEIVGFIVTVSISVSILIHYFLGKVIDKSDKKKFLKVSTFFYFFGWIGRLFVDSVFKVLAVDSFKNLSEKVLLLFWSAKSYDIAVREKYFRFIVAREIVFNLARVFVLPFIILIFYVDFHPFKISFIVAALFTLLYPMLSD